MIEYVLKLKIPMTENAHTWNAMNKLFHRWSQRHSKRQAKDDHGQQNDDETGRQKSLTSWAKSRQNDVEKLPKALAEQPQKISRHVL